MSIGRLLENRETADFLLCLYIVVRVNKQRICSTVHFVEYVL